MWLLLTVVKIASEKQKLPLGPACRTLALLPTCCVTSICC